MISGSKIKEVREKYKLTLKDISELTKLPAAYLQEVEAGEKELTGKALGKILKVLNVDAKELGINDEAWSSVLTSRIGDKIRALREQKGLSLLELGEILNLSFTYLSELERGTIVPSMVTLRNIADFFNVPVSLFIGNERKNSLISEKLQRIRKLKGLSQKELAQKANLSPGLIGQLETDKVHASLKTLEKLANALGVSVCYLIIEQEEVESIIGAISPEFRELLYQPNVQMILGSICALPEEKLKLVLNFIQMLSNPAIQNS